jgi:predicted regulator of Ras-like GTPase activity (Roadblock/LC7/MglB family)
MAVKGNLDDISLSSLITLCCYEKKQICLSITHGEREAALFFKDGKIIHAALDSQEGEELIAELLSWKEGAFEIEQDVTPSKHSVTTDWNGLFFEDMRYLNEDGAKRVDSDAENIKRQPLITLSREGFEKVGHLLCNLLSAVRGRCVLIADRGGRLVHWQGRIDRDQAISLAALIAGNFLATAEIAEALHKEGETRQFKQSLQEGEDFSIFSVPVGERSVMSLCFTSNSNVPLGFVRIHTLKVASEIQEVLVKNAVQDMSGQLMEDLSHDIRGALNDLFGD